MSKSNSNGKSFSSALEGLGVEKGISEDVVRDALGKAFTTVYTKKLENEYALVKGARINKAKDATKLSDALVRIDLNFEKGTLKLFHQRKVTKDDEITDDFIEVSDTDPRVVEKNLKDGDFLEEEIPLSEFTPGDVKKVKGNFHQIISKAEKDALMEAYSGKIGEIMSGVVEKSDSHMVLVNLGRTSATLFEKDLIGQEHFKPGDVIKVYIKGIGKSDQSKSGSIIQISRSCPGFLRKLFESEIHEIYDGTVIIKDVARIPGVRSKIVVYSNDPNVDASGACIGQNGTRIQAIVSQLGNAKDNKEKIDVITYNENRGLYLAECLKPGIIIGLVIDDASDSALAVCEDGTANLAIGHGGSNVNLARRLTGLKEVTIKDKKEAEAAGLSYKPIEFYQAQAREEERKKVREEAVKQAINKYQENENGAFAKIEEPTKTDSFLSKDEDIDSEEDLDTGNIEQGNKAVENPVNVQPTQQVSSETKSVEEAPKEKVEVKTTISLDALEASLEKEKKEQSQSNVNGGYRKRFKKGEKKPTEEKSPAALEEDKKNIQKMDIYTEEELKALENENQDEKSDENEDFSDYDSDDYYEDK
jgi:N utilization substance protein A